MGDTGGAPMSGVINCPLTTSQKLYRNDFQRINSNHVAHPYTTTTSNHSGSTPYNILTGTAYVPSAYKAGMVKSEYTRQFSETASSTKFLHASGGRVEQLCR